MSLKPTTLKLLAFLYADRHLFLASYEHLTYLLPQLSRPGLRSLVAHGVKQGWISTERLGNITQIRITSHGIEAARRRFPAFLFAHDRESREAMVIFLTPPKRDLQFRYLRSVLVEHQAIALARGVYLVPQWSKEKVKDEVELSYRNAVLMIETTDWLSGDKRTWLMERYQLPSLADLYSGLSKEIDRMLKQKRPFSSLTDREKKAIFSVFERLYSLIQIDSGYVAIFFPQLSAPSDLIEKWRRLLTDSF